MPIAKKPARDGQAPGATGTQHSWDHGGGGGGLSVVEAASSGEGQGHHMEVMRPGSSLLLPSDLLSQLLLIELYWKPEGKGAPVMQLKASLGWC